MRSSLVLSILAVTGCVATPAPQPDPTLSGIAATDLDPQLEAALCQLWVRCGVYQDLAACEAANPGSTPWTREQAAADAANGVVTYDGGKAAACVERIAGASCSDRGFSPDSIAVGLLTAECDLFARGTVEIGGACNEDAACDGNTTCSADPAGPSAGQCLSGTCTQIDNRICGPNRPPCPGDEVCEPGGVCGGDRGSGDTCSESVDCVKGLRCAGLYDLYGPTGSGTCGPRLPVGDACDTDDDCDAIGASCVTITVDDYGQDVRRCLAYAGLGETCSTPGELNGYAPCKRDAICNRESGRCVALPPAGAACPDYHCAPGAYCIGAPDGASNICKPVGAAGASCTAEEQCAAYCNAGTCVDATVCTP